MNAVMRYTGRGRRIVAALVLLLSLSAGGCSGITPDSELRNNREEGPEKGLFSGSDGEFVLVGPAKETVPAEKKPQAEASK